MRCREIFQGYCRVFWIVFVEVYEVGMWDYGMGVGFGGWGKV